jgi:hypothetical protein
MALLTASHQINSFLARAAYQHIQKHTFEENICHHSRSSDVVHKH